MAAARPRLVTFEGIDGSGKSTLLAALEAALPKQGIEAVFTREETPTWTGEAVRRAIRDDADPLVTLYLFLADRAAHLASLRPRLDDGALVLSDRYHDSTRAYQAVTLADRFGGVAAYEKWLAAQVAPWLVVPARTYLLDLPAEAAVARMSVRKGKTPYEKTAFLERVAEQYHRLAKFDPTRWVVLDATAPTPDTVEKVLADLLAVGLLGVTPPSGSSPTP